MSFFIIKLWRLVRPSVCMHISSFFAIFGILGGAKKKSDTESKGLDFLFVISSADDGTQNFNS